MEREKTVVVINDALGGIAYAFQKAGFKVLCDVVPDENSGKIAEKNLSNRSEIKILKSLEQSCMEMPEASILVGHIMVQGFGSASYKRIETEYRNRSNEKIYQLKLRT